MPPSKALSSTRPSKSIRRTSPFAPARSTGSSFAKPAWIRSISRSIISSGACGSARPTSSPWYSPSSAPGRTPISNLKDSGSPSSSGAETISMFGSPIGLRSASNSASSYQSGSDSPERLLEDGAEADALDHQRRRRFAFAEARQPHLTCEAAGGALDAATDLLSRDLDLDPPARRAAL